MRRHIELHHEYPGQAFFIIADYHALTRQAQPRAVRLGVVELAATCLALGLNHREAILYRQSDVPEPRANVVAVGFGWRFSDFAADVGGERRTLVRTGEPRSAEDRVVVSLRVPR